MLHGDGAGGVRVSRDTSHLKAVVTEEDISSTSNPGPALAQHQLQKEATKAKRTSREDQSLGCEMENSDS